MHLITARSADCSLREASCCKIKIYHCIRACIRFNRRELGQYIQYHHITKHQRFSQYKTVTFFKNTNGKKFKNQFIVEIEKLMQFKAEEKHFCLQEVLNAEYTQIIILKNRS